MNAIQLERILNTLHANKNGHIRGKGRASDMIQSLNLQETERLKAVVSKYDKIFDCQNNFPPITCSVSEIEKWQYKLSKLKSELEKLKAE